MVRFLYIILETQDCTGKEMTEGLVSKDKSPEECLDTWDIPVCYKAHYTQAGTLGDGIHRYM